MSPLLLLLKDLVQVLHLREKSSRTSSNDQEKSTHPRLAFGTVRDTRSLPGCDAGRDVFRFLLRSRFDREDDAQLGIHDLVLAVLVDTTPGCRSAVRGQRSSSE